MQPRGDPCKVNSIPELAQIDPKVVYSRSFEMYRQQLKGGQVLCWMDEKYTLVCT